MIQKATIKDCKNIHALIISFSKKGVMLPRSLNYVYENIRDFWVYKNGPRIIGCCALHIVGWDDLAEIKSLSVDQSSQKKGIGRSLVMQCLEEAKNLGVKKVFALTYVPSFFKKQGFKIIDKNSLPHKIWSDCIDCAFFPGCNEIAVIKKLN